jgi:hypothetical protein
MQSPTITDTTHPQLTTFSSVKTAKGLLLTPTTMYFPPPGLIIDYCLSSWNSPTSQEPAQALGGSDFIATLHLLLDQLHEHFDRSKTVNTQVQWDIVKDTIRTLSTTPVVRL